MRTAITELISAARGQAERMRRASFAHEGDDYAQRLAQAEAKHWQELANAAEQEAAAGLIGRPARVEDIFDHD